MSCSFNQNIQTEKKQENQANKEQALKDMSKSKEEFENAKAEIEKEITTSDNLSKIQMPKNINTELINLYAKSDFSFSINGNSNSATAEIKIAAYDSAYIRITGPFGIQVAKAFATNKYFLFLNSFNGSAMEGTPSPEAIANFIQTELSYENFLDILRAKLLFSADKYKYYDTQNEQNRFEYKDKQNSDFVILDKYNRISSYLRKVNEQEAFKIEYNYSAGKGNVNYLKSMKLFIPKANGTIRFDFDEYKDLILNIEPFSFQISPKIKVTNINK